MNVPIHGATGPPLAILEWEDGKLYYTDKRLLPSQVMDWAKWMLAKPGVTAGSITLDGLTYSFDLKPAKVRTSLTRQNEDPIQRALDEGRAALKRKDMRHNPDLDAVFTW
jgi:hypothetical protein